MFELADVNFDLLKKYDTSGPRYTSYPTAPQFTEQFTSKNLIDEVRTTNSPNTSARPLSLYFHLPFCESVCFFCGCNVTFTSDRKRPIAYTGLLVQEMDQIVPLIQSGRKVSQLHWGGGTPTFFTPDQLKFLHEATRSRFSFDPQAEVGLEVDPRETTSEHMKTLAQLGFNRLSMGVQDFDPDVQKAVNRIQGEDITRRVIEEARSLGFRSISVDLIYGLPNQTEQSFSQTLKKILKLNPDRIALFNFAYLPELIRHQKKAIKKEALPSSETKFAILKHAIRVFTDEGYRYVGMDHFAKPSDELCQAQDNGTLYRNFQGYTTNAGCDLYAFGVSAISQIGNTYSQNKKNIHEYEADITSGKLAVHRGLSLSADDRLRRDIIMNLMCHFSLSFSRFDEEYGICFEEYFAESIEQLQPMIDDKLLEVRDRKLIVNSVGRLLVRNICMVFDAYLKNKPGLKFSRTI